MAKAVLINVLVVLVLSFAAGATTFDIAGNTYNATKGELANVNVTIEVYSDWSTLDSALSAVSNGSGYYNISGVTSDPSYMYKLIPRHYNDSFLVDYIGSSLPSFPYFDFTQMLNLSAVNFYLKEAATIYVNAVNQEGDPQSFQYMVKDSRLGYPIKEGWQGNVYNFTVYLPSDRNYSIEIFPSSGIPIFYDVNNLSDYDAPKSLNLTFNATTSPRWVSGYMAGAEGFDTINIIGYLLEPGNMVFADQAMPYNMSAFAGNSDFYNASTGFYNITIPGTAMSSKVLMFAAASNGNSNYGAFRNISLSISGDNIDNFNFTMQKMLGSASSIIVYNGGDSNNPVNITTSKVTFELINSSGDGITTAQVHVETDVDYSSLYTGGPSFTFMTDVSSGGTGTFALSLLNNSIDQMNLFTQNFAPLKKSLTVAQLSTDPVSITMRSFNPGGIDSNSGEMEDLFMDLLKSSSECDVPSPPSGCSFMGDDQAKDSFKPLNAVISGGKISFRMRKASNNITVHYKDVDMLASGPPDAAFDGSANESESGASLEQAWRFGSLGPEIYSQVLIGIPYNDSAVDEGQPMSVLLNNLYDNDWNVIWGVDINGTPDQASDLPSDYQEFNLSWFTGNGMPCRTTDSAASCFANTTVNMLWLTIPHFSGIGPSIKSTSIGALTLNSTSLAVDCTRNCTVYINATNLNATIANILQNITINATPTVSNVLYFDIYRHNNSEFVFNATNSSYHTGYNLTLYNGSSNTVHQYKIMVNKTNTSTTQLNFSFAIEGQFAANLLINLTCVESWTCLSWGACSSSTQTRSCSDDNACGTELSKPAISRTCNSGHSSSGSGSGIETIAPSNPNEASKASQKWGSVAAGAAATMAISDDKIGATRVKFVLSQASSGDIGLDVASFKAEPSGLSDSIPGKVYQYLEISPSGFSSISSAAITFRVEKAWISESNIAESSVVLMHYTDSKWIVLDTKKIAEDPDYITYEAVTSSFSYFAIASTGTAPEAAPLAAAPAAQVNEAAKATPPSAPESEPAEGVSVEGSAGGNGIVVAIIATVVVIAGIALYIAGRKKNKK